MTVLKERLLAHHEMWLTYRDHQHGILQDNNSNRFNERLNHCRVIAFVQGALGQSLLVQLSQLPVAELTIIPITPSDVNFVQRVRSKLQARANQFRVQFEVAHIHQLSMQITQYDFAVMATSRPFPEFAEYLNRGLLHTTTHGIFAQLGGIHFSLGPLVVPGIGACYACYMQRLRTNSPHPDVDVMLEHYFRGDFEFDWEGQHPTINMMAAGLIAAEVLRFATGYRAPTTLSSELYATLLYEQTYKHHVIMPDFSCPVCSDLRKRLSPQPSYTLQSVVEKYAQN